MKPTITTFNNRLHRKQVISLWEEVFKYTTVQSRPEFVIDKKLEFGDELFFVAADNLLVVGTVMAGYDGHRGWIYSLAVTPDYRKQGIAASLLSFAEEKLSELGCAKINLQIMGDNDSVEDFYKAHGYQTEDRISMGKKIPENIRNKQSF